MENKYLKHFIIILIITLAFIYGNIFGYENPENIESIKSYFKKKTNPEIKISEDEFKEVTANSFSINFKKIISLSEKTAFIIHKNNFSEFSESSLKIYTQNGFVIENFKQRKLNLPKNFTLQRNGGLKTVFTYKNKSFGLITSLNNNCYYGSVVSLENSKELFKTKCLPGPTEKIDFNGIGSSNIHLNNKIYLSIGTPEQSSSQISILSQDDNSMFGKIVDNFILNDSSKININFFSKGHRTPQGLTKINNNIFAVEHGPKGGDELNKITNNKNYGWPKSSYGTKYMYDDDGKSYENNHEKFDFTEPLFALVPSVGISSLNTCPSKLKNFYKKSCLMALSLYGNNLRPGRSLIIFLLNETMDRVHSIEQIYLGNGLKLRHFITNAENELYEDTNGAIYVSADKKGIYKIDFIKFR